MTTPRAEDGVWDGVGSTVLWRASTLDPDAVGSPDEEAAETVLGPDVERWRLMHAADPVRGARLFAGRAAVHGLVTTYGLFPWRGFSTSVPGRKPGFAGDENADFSVSHSGRHLLIAVVRGGRVGVDVEVNETIFDRPGVVRRMCTVSEAAFSESLDDATRRAWLARLWTAKEAATKLDGRGLRADFRTIDLGERISLPETTVTIAATIAASTSSTTVRLCHPLLSPAAEALVA